MPQFFRTWHLKSVRPSDEMGVRLILAGVTRVSRSCGGSPWLLVLGRVHAGITVAFPPAPLPIPIRCSAPPPPAPLAGKPPVWDADPQIGDFLVIVRVCFPELS